ncbi:hypothetical protein B4U80_00784 [Leptotrombidium deliense]
MGTET